MKNDNPKVLSCGNVSVDIKAFSFEADEAEAYRDGTIDLVSGGVGRGMAINLAHLGLESAICSCVGTDIFGDYLRKEMEAEHINTSLLKTVPGGHTALFSVMASAGKPASCVYSTGITQDIVFDDEVRAFLDKGGANIVCLDSNLSRETLARFYDYRKNHDIFLFQNATAPDIAKKSLEFAPYADLFACNEAEASAITGKKAFPDADFAREFASLGYRHFIITFGSLGVMVYKDGEVWNEKPYATDSIVDTIGAGDAFASGYIFGCTSSAPRPVKRCIQFGLACAKETLRTRQTVSNLLTAQLVENYPDHK